MNVTTKPISNSLTVLRITNMVMLQHFDVISDRFNVVEIMLIHGSRKNLTVNF
jgi:hypothetical protein